MFCHYKKNANSFCQSFAEQKLHKEQLNVLLTQQAAAFDV